MGYCKDCKNGEVSRYGIYCNVYHHTYNEYDGCDRHFSPKQSSSSSGCFLTTACVEIMGKPDDCYELNTLRNFRDNFILKDANGGLVINEYYVLAPQIVKEISKRDDANEVFKKIYNDLIVKTVKLIEESQFSSAYILYKQYILNLKDEFLSE